MEVVMGWELHIVRTEHWFDSASVPISSEEWLQLVNDDKELSIDNKNGDFLLYGVVKVNSMNLVHHRRIKTIFVGKVDFKSKKF